MSPIPKFPVVTYSCESWTIKKEESQRIDAFKLWLEKTPESPLDCKGIKPVILKGDKPWIFTGRTDAEAEAPVFWSSNVNKWLIRKVPDAGKHWRQKEKQTQRIRWCDGIIDVMNKNFGKHQEMLRDREAWNATVYEITKSWTELDDWIKKTSPTVVNTGSAWLSKTLFNTTCISY